MSSSGQLVTEIESDEPTRVGAVDLGVGGAAEADRLASLYAYDLLDTPPEEAFDEIVALAAEICGAPMALVSLVDEDRQWFKARVGIDMEETPRAVSFCQYAIALDSEVMAVPDARLDERFSTNPFVTGDPHVRLYAGAVIRDPQGRGLGALCVLDRRARHLSGPQLEALAVLARQVSALIELRRGSAALAHAETALEAAANGGPRCAIVTLDLGLRILGWSGDAQRLFGYSASAVTGRLLNDVLGPEVTADAEARIRAELEKSGRWEGNLTYHRRNGSPVRVRASLEARRDGTGRTVGYVVRSDDLTSPSIERLCHETYASIVTRMAAGQPLATLSADLCRVVEQACPGARATLMAVDEATGALGMVAAPSMSASFTNAFEQVPIGAQVGSCGTAAYLGKVVISPDLAVDPKWEGWRGVPRSEGLAACWSQPIMGPTGSVLGTFGVYWAEPHTPDVDERQLITTLASLAAIVLTARRSERATDHRDDLTGLPTRSGLDRALTGLEPDTEICVVAVGVDRFEMVLPQYGNDVSDTALRQVATRLRLLSSEGTIVARLASDRFALVIVDPIDGHRLAERLVRASRAPVIVERNELWLTASVGLARGPAAHGDFLVHAAVVAAEKAKLLGGNRLIDAEVRPSALHLSSLELVGALHRAVASGDLDVHYQPKIRVSTGAVEGFEALVRWNRADGTPVAPSEFIPLAEEIGLIDAIGEHVLRRACTDATGWTAAANQPTPPGVAVNISARQLIASQLAATIADVLASTGLSPSRLTLEVTETALAEDIDTAITALREVKKLGVGVAIDDFGIGYSSLGYLSRFPVDELKIDSSFVDRMDQDPAVDAIVRSVVALSHNLGLRCTAEGVERADQLDYLTVLGCDAIQGYLFSPAVPNASVQALIRKSLPPPSKRSRRSVLTSLHFRPTSVPASVVPATR